MVVLKKILYKFLILTVLLIGMSFIYTRFFYENDLQQHSDIINAVRLLPSDVDIVYIGESSNSNAREDDIDKRRISDFIGDYYPNLVLADITKPASHAGIYSVIIENISENKPLKTLIITLNMRSFNAGWIYSNLETPLQKSLMLLKDYPPFVNRFLLSFKAYDIKSDKERVAQVRKEWDEKLHFPYEFPYKSVNEWDYATANNRIKDIDGEYNQALTELACHYVKGYAFQIDTLNNPRIEDFNRIVSYAKKRNWNLVFNLLAENVEKASFLVGKDLLYLMEENRKILVDYYSKKGVLVVDNLYAVEDNQFTDQSWTTEHYAERGRKIVARNVALGLKAFHENEFTETEKRNFYQTDFFNNCEREDSGWQQMENITEENAYSGKYSSPTGKGLDYSIGLSTDLSSIPDSLKKEIEIHLEAFAFSQNHKAQLVIEAKGKEDTKYWKSYPLVVQLKDINTWKQISYRLPIPNELKSMERLSIYVYNPSEGRVLIDDFSIKFH